MIWAIDAIDDLKNAQAYISLFDPRAARRFADRIIEAADNLATFPNRGSPIAGGLRQWSLVHPCRIRYRVTGDRVEIVAVRHAARDEPEGA